MPAQPLLTYDDYIALPEDGPRHELYEGKLVVMPATSPLHQAASAESRTRSSPRSRRLRRPCLRWLD